MSKPSSPYVGPRPFEREHAPLFFGRDREANELVSLIISHTEVLLYAQSGAGKSSLVNARLIPLLEAEDFDVLPPRHGCREWWRVSKPRTSRISMRFTAS
jgi:hypothetical protein